MNEVGVDGVDVGDRIQELDVFKAPVPTQSGAFAPTDLQAA
jgi:hypothetical protein